MARDQQEPSLIIELPTPSPTLDAIIVLVPRRDYDRSNKPAIGVTYKDWKQPTRESVDVFGNFTMLQRAMEGVPEDYFGWYFVASQEEEEANTAVETWFAHERYHWPRELLLLEFYVVDLTFPYPTWDAHTVWSLTGVTQAPGETKLVPHKRVRESFSGLTMMKYERFVSREPWTDTFLAADGAAVPQPAMVEWDLPGTKGEEPDVLHNGIFIPRSYFATLGAYRQDQDYGDPVVGSPVPTSATSIRHKNYAATNHPIWTTHTANNEVKPKGYFYERLKVTAYAPPRPMVWS